MFLSKKLIPYIFSFIFWNFPKQKIIIETFFMLGSPVAFIVCRAYCSPQWDCFIHQDDTINKIKKVYFMPRYLQSLLKQDLYLSHFFYQILIILRTKELWLFLNFMVEHLTLMLSSCLLLNIVPQLWNHPILQMLETSSESSVIMCGK